VALRSRSEKQRLVNPRKVYVVDPGLAAAMYSGGAVNLGAQLETFVYLELRRRLGLLAGRAVSYYRTKGGREVEFAVDPIVPANDSVGPATGLQLCTNLESPGYAGAGTGSADSSDGGDRASGWAGSDARRS
jgi:hypothetical protein